MSAATVELQANRSNLLLAQLAVHERNAIHRDAETVSLAIGDVVQRAQTHSDHVFFPVSSVLSLVRSLRDNVSMQIAMIGNEGMVGVDVVTEAKTQLDDVVVTSPGWAYRLSADDFRNQFRRGGGLQRYLLRFMGALLTQVAQTSVCNFHHAAEARLARWLLMVNERTSRAVVPASPATLLTVLGVDRHRISDAIGKLSSAKAITTGTDTISILDREGLEVRACECYETIRQEYERTLSS